MTARQILFVALIVVASTVALALALRPTSDANHRGTTSSPSDAPHARSLGLDPVETDAAGRARARLEGVVFAADATPHEADVLVFAETSAANEERRVVARAHAGPDGSFAVDALVASVRYAVVAHAPGLVSALAHDVVVSADAGATRLELRFGESGVVVVSGHVRDASGAPLPRAIIWSRRETAQDRDAIPSETDATGHYEAALARGQYVLLAAAEGFAPDDAWLIATRDATLDFTLGRGAIVRGHVVAHDGSPVSGATLVLERTPTSRRGYHSATSDASGAFEIAGLSGGAYDIAAARGPLFGRLPRPVTARAGEIKADVVIEIARAQAITGHVRNHGGAAIPGAVVSARTSGSESVRASAVSASDGAYKLDAIPAGKIAVRADADGYASVEIAVDVDDGRDEHGADLVLADEIVLRGKVVSDKGDVVVGALVTDGDHNQSTTASNGTFELRTRASQVVALTAEHRDYGFASLHLEPKGQGVDDLVLTLLGGATISGHVLRPEGDAAVGVFVTSGDEVATTDDDGAFALVHVRPGDVVVRASENGAPNSASALRAEDPAVVKRHVAAGEHVDGVRLVLTTKAARISGVVVDSNNQPIADASVGAVPDEDDAPQVIEAAILEQLGDSQKVARSAADGTFVIANLEAGTYIVWASHEGLARVSVPHVASGATNVRLRFAPATRLAGAVVGPDGSPATSYRLLVRGTLPDGTPRDSEAHAVASTSGAFDVRGLAAGTYSLLAQTTDGRAARLDEVVLGDGEQKDGLRLVMTNGVAIEGRVVDASTRRPLSGIHVTLTGQVGSADTDDAGVFRIYGLAAEGRVRLYADDTSSDDYVYDARTIDLTLRQGRISLGEIWLMHAPGAEPEGETGLECENYDGRVIVTYVRSGSPAMSAGLRLGDRITVIETIEASPFGDAAIDLMLRGSVGSSVSVTLVRAYSVRRVSVILAPAPPSESDRAPP